jgi:hypothetical protein
MASVKWVARITVLTEAFAGYFQHERYVLDFGDGALPLPVREMEVKSRITSPAAGDTIATGPVVVRGWAWSGAAPVTRVEVAVDGGDTWREARLSPRAGGYLWQPWEFDWNPAEPGRHTLRVRAHDAAGRSQPHAPRWNRLGYAANGIHPLIVEVR